MPAINKKTCFVTCEDIESNHVNFGVSVFPGLRGGHLNNLTGTILKMQDLVNAAKHGLLIKWNQIVFGQLTNLLQCTLKFLYVVPAFQECLMCTYTWYNVSILKKFPNLYHNEATLPESRALQREGCGSSGVSTIKIKSFLGHCIFGIQSEKNVSMDQPRQEKEEACVREWNKTGNLMNMWLRWWEKVYFLIIDHDNELIWVLNPTTFTQTRSKTRFTF